MIMGLLDGKVAIITGSARGIGKGIAEKFVAEGCAVTINDIDAAPCTETENELKAKGAKVISCVADVTNEEQVNKMVADTIAAFGKIDILVNCAGVTADAMINKMTDKQYRFVVDVNLKGTIVCTKAVAPEFLKEERKDQFKKIVNFASTTGVSGNVGQTNYAMAKGAIIAYTKACAREMAADRVCVNTVAPGFIETRMTQEKKPGEKMGIPKAIRDLAIQAIPFSRNGQGGLPEHVANVILFYCSSMGDWITGQLLTIDGGGFI
jgi:3-oxoacyl-[acyl-carrier protein] reductase